MPPREHLCHEHGYLFPPLQQGAEQNSDVGILVAIHVQTGCHIWPFEHTLAGFTSTVILSQSDLLIALLKFPEFDSAGSCTSITRLFDYVMIESLRTRHQLCKVTGHIKQSECLSQIRSNCSPH